jgi:hypothetical protein
MSHKSDACHNSQRPYKFAKKLQQQEHSFLAHLRLLLSSIPKTIPRRLMCKIFAAPVRLQLPLPDLPHGRTASHASNANNNFSKQRNTSLAFFFNRTLLKNPHPP